MYYDITNVLPIVSFLFLFIKTNLFLDNIFLFLLIFFKIIFFNTSLIDLLIRININDSLLNHYNLY